MGLGDCFGSLKNGSLDEGGRGDDFRLKLAVLGTLLRVFDESEIIRAVNVGRQTFQPANG